VWCESLLVGYFKHKTLLQNIKRCAVFFCNSSTYNYHLGKKSRRSSSLTLVFVLRLVISHEVIHIDRKPRHIRSVASSRKIFQRGFEKPVVVHSFRWSFTRRMRDSVASSTYSTYPLLRPPANTFTSAQTNT